MLLQRLGWTLHTLLSHYRRHPLQTLFLFVGLITGVGLWAAVQVINAHARASYTEADQLLGAQASHWVRAADDGGIDPAVYVKLRRAGFRQLYPVLEARLTTSEQQPLSLIATDLLALPAGSEAAFEVSENWTELIQPPFQAWFPQTLAENLNIQAGERLLLASGVSMPSAVLQTRPQQGQRVFMDIGAAMTLLQRTRFSYLAVGGLTPDRAKALREALPPNLRLVANQQSLDLTELTQSLHSHLTAMSLLSFAVGLFIVFNAVRFSLNARSTTLATLQELGVSMRMLSGAIVLETLLLSVFGAILGVALGYVVAQQLLPSVATSLQNLYGAVLDHRLLLRPYALLEAWGMTLGGLVLALSWPLWQRARQALTVQRSMSEDWRQDSEVRRWLAAGAIVLLVAAAMLYPQLDSVATGFVVLALFLFAAAWLLPALLALALFALQACIPAQAWHWRWAMSDGWAQLPVLRTALMALLLALTANFGVDTLVNSFRSALQSWLDQRIAADMYIQSDKLSTDTLFNSDLIRDHHLRNGMMLRWQKRPTRIIGLDTRAPDTLQLPMAKSGDDLSAWYQGDVRTVLANEQVHYLAGINLGDRITLPTPKGELAFIVAGFYYDYGNPYFQFYLPYSVVEQLWPTASVQGLALWLQMDETGTANQESRRAIRPLIERTLMAAGAKPGDWLYRDDILQVSLEIFERTFAITAAMNTLTLSVAGIALLASLLAIHQRRLPEYAHWRAMGVRRREWLLIILLPLMLTVFITWALSMPLGTLLAWILIKDLNVLSFGWTMPMLLQFWPGLRLALLTCLVVTLTIMITLLQVRYRLPLAIKQLGGEL
ncbi:MAG: FtsX-like permease family protein [Gammaproteobacteria bacterium]